MEEKKITKISLSTFLLILAIIAIIVMGIFIYKLHNDKTNEIKKSTELQTQVNNLNNTINDLQGKINTISKTINSNNSNDNLENTSNISAKCKTAFENYYDLQSELYSGGSLYVLKKLNLVSEIPSSEQYETTTYDSTDFYKTDIKYSDFKNAMLKYMTDELYNKKFEDNFAKNVNGYLQITAMGGTATYINIHKFELSSDSNNSYVFNLVGEKSYDDGAPKTDINMKVTFEKQNENYVVSNIEE